ncbi:hypothetical protein F5X99DRAFT_421456 [Biscogniauxia marginata]|nr:hypothetical protein F5X99DRAFT_421456 [Biscogniauxia marginata]
MKDNLRSVEDSDFTDSERAIFYSVKLADDITFFCKSAEGESVILDVVCYVPPGHLWQVSLIQSLAIPPPAKLRPRRGERCRQFILAGELTLHPNKKLSLWRQLPILSACVREKWNDPTETGEELYEEFEKWKNLNSFVARLTSTGFAPWFNLPIWQLRMALEERPVEGSAMESRLCVASEWILHCADSIFKNTTSKEELDEGTARALGTGSLCDDSLPPLSVERWGFWKKRFSEFATDTSSLKLDSPITGRILDTWKRMNVVVKQAS